MSKFGLIFILVLISYNISAQEIAVNERGDSIVLFSNKTWEYLENYRDSNTSTESIEMNSGVFKKPQSSTTKISGKNKFYEIYYSDKKWKRIPPENLNQSADIALQMTNGDVYGMVIYEELEIPAENLVNIALDTALGAAPDIKLVQKEYRVVNNDTVICMRMDGTYNGIKISYFSYYYSNIKGTIQFHTFTGQALLDKYLKDIEDLLNGLIIGKLE
jgi:hypothetical protein